MANALKGKTSACLVFVTPNERATEAPESIHRRAHGIYEGEKP